SMLINGLFLGMLLGNLTSGNMILATVGPLMVGGAFALFYTVWLESSTWQATLGKRLLGIKVVDLEGRRIGFGKSSWRNMAKGLSMLTLGVGYLMPLWDHRRQALHDKAAGCLVVRATRESAAGRVARFA
ncbi:MAG: RDD family protein, partial [Proteobacteria bacterium]|nr:RDD family protein [Pseudomonadota bacterium]